MHPTDTCIDNRTHAPTGSPAAIPDATPDATCADPGARLPCAAPGAMPCEGRACTPDTGADHWQALLDWLAGGVSPEADWPGLAGRLANLLQADFCCVVMRHRQEGRRLSISAHGRGGALSIAARRELVRSGSLIRALLCGEPADLGAVRPQALYQVVRIDGEAIGVLHARRDGAAVGGFAPAQRAQAAAVAALVGQALQLGRLQGLMQAEYARLALLRAPDGGLFGAVGPGWPSGPAGAPGAPGAAVADPAGMARRLAAALYREFRTLRLDDRHVVAAAAELVALLSADLRTRLVDASKRR